MVRTQAEINKVNIVVIDLFISSVTFNVGGTLFTTYMSTINREPSMLSALVSGKYAKTVDEKGQIFLDRFRLISFKTQRPKVFWNCLKLPSKKCASLNRRYETR
jgi:hypothetical protein